MSLVIYRHGLAFGGEMLYLNGTVFLSDPQFNYEPIVGALPWRWTTEAAIPPAIVPVVNPIVLKPSQPGNPQAEIPEPSVFWLFALVVAWLLLGRCVCRQRV